MQNTKLPINNESRHDLMEELYSRYARGGSRFAGYRAYTGFIFKKYSWVVVTESTYLFKRLLDIVASMTLMTLFSPVFVVTVLIIKIESSGPAFYSQIRVGKWGKHFKFYKFRSMVTGADKMKDQLLDKDESGGITFKMRRDPRITEFGRIMRKLSIDELPQLWNVLKGDMSMVGPRPPVPREVEEYKYADRRRLDTIPGITCIWQVSGRSDIDFKGQVRLDVQYIESLSFWGDIKILFKTIPAVLLGRGAY